MTDEVVAVRGCPRCGAEAAAHQEFCLECGSKLPGEGRVGRAAPDSRRTVAAIALAGVVALAGTTLAIWLTWTGSSSAVTITATGGSATVPAPTTPGGASLAVWPKGRDGWTIVLVSVPHSAGRDAAIARAQSALDRGLKRVGILDSSLYPSLQPGSWVVFSGVYSSQPEATSNLRSARGVVRTAHTQRVG